CKTGEGMKEEIDAISSRITALSEDINRSLQELDETRKNADEFHEQFVKFSQESTKEHEAFIQAKTELRDLEKVTSSLRTKTRAIKKKEKEGELQKKATTLFDKFKNGEQLTTEDLLTLQKAGFL
ncbi:MAG: phosphoserine phosphatase, partial [Candidatus Thermoplasmatota archaeon]|nr:phosphoserine phosphatase [Candidatus Thermoplasmatota archaeon]